MLKIVGCPVCQKETRFSDETETVQTGCPACGKVVTSFICLYCNSEFTPDDIGEISEYLVQS
ncbi:MAG: hypothetical protein A3C38_01410 [Planctomycetes bacterium RIFCSPHIGHO2_02_FULL_50_42]|nr:MAG: hypothetical protein A2060_08030 [Planctomycetes bacterium GWA2_50_13]OHB86957.1 MAG: hypothetical protein A3C38_01410 [Planctomycetes bacterium RIFCSPHIGHO2_02_FULL_50_42]OHB92306.1 MAG: hypothetical protein A3E75_03550 [Planctomycetes bacterium RIFCSPHIGHO2_12_FULL_51_37]OHB96254.1 MAG: hypothetical protein A3I59_04510 [Planctomycetes bacterium RIFCSPLOWO2_02_FULL_50_16]OHC04738.1 MAG: hypothetical protein A3G17_04125 [Planctomycetes bacterium RIFCSPLOWO2_12_FULL_50_35]HCN19397.1 hyp